MKSVKNRLKAVFDVMQRIETHGESTMMMAECLREMARIIQDTEEPAEKPQTMEVPNE